MIKLIGNYAKRLGLPGYSSHQFSISVETELADSGNIQGEATRIYHLLQDAVDREIQETGFVPPHSYGMVDNHDNGKTSQNRLQGAVAGATGSNGGDRWACSDKQRELILAIVTENNISRTAVDNTAHDRFGVGVRDLNKLQASGLITELLETTGTGNGNGGRNGNGGHNGGRNGNAATARKGGGR